MRTLLLLFILIIGLNSQAQSLVIEKEKMSSGDENIDLEIIGNSSFFEIACISTNGQVYSYDGRLLHQWNNSRLKNTKFFESIYLTDSILYVQIEDKFYSFSKNSDFPIKISKKEVRNKTPFPWDHPFPQQNNSFEITSNSLLWKNTNLNIETSTLTQNTTHLITSLWGKPYFLSNNKLHSATPSTLSYEKNALLINNQKPLKSFSTPYNLIYFYNNFIHIPQFSQSINLPQDIQSPGNILNILSASPTPFSNQPASSSYLPIILHTQNNCYIYRNNNWFTAPHKLPTNTLITSTNIQEDFILFTTKEQGVFTYKISEDPSSQNHITPHKLNTKLADFEFINSFFLNDKLFFATKKNGIFNIEKNTLKIHKIPIKIKEIIPFNDHAIIVSTTGELLKFDSNYKLTKLKHRITITNPLSLLASENQLLYSKNDSLHSYDTKEQKITNSIPFKILLNQAFTKKKKVYAYINNDLYTNTPSYSRNKTPKLTNAYITTSQNKKHEVFPSKKPIQLTTDDYPLTFWAKASFLENPSSIEYRYSWNDAKVKQRPFRYNNDYQLNTKLIGTAQAKITVKSGNQFSSFNIAPIVTSRVQEQVDYSFVLYLALGIIALLLGIILLGLLKNRRQTKKILQLETQQKMIELEQKSLQMQMNPHFIFNSLNGVKGMIALGKIKNAKEYLTKIAGWMRNMLNDSRSSQVLLKDEVKNLDLYLDIEQKLRGNSFSYAIENLVNDDSLSIPSMMIQPFLENSIVHAFDGSQENAHINISFEKKGRKIEVIVEDNGKGIQEKKSSHKSVAMSLIKDRLKLWNDKGNLYGVDVINKSVNEHGSTGIKVHLRLPIK